MLSVSTLKRQIIDKIQRQRSIKRALQHGIADACRELNKCEAEGDATGWNYYNDSIKHWGRELREANREINKFAHALSILSTVQDKPAAGKSRCAAEPSEGCGCPSEAALLGAATKTKTKEDQTTN
jgi:hypothetical protein